MGELVLPVEGQLPSLDGLGPWINSPPLTREQLQGQGRGDRLLDLQLHQLPALDPLREGVGRTLSQGRPGRHRRPRARIRVRTQSRQCPPSGRRSRHPLSGRARQRLCAVARAQATITGRRITSSMPGAGSVTTISAKAITRCPSASSASCWPRPAMRRRASGWEPPRPPAPKPRPRSASSSRPRPTSAMRAPTASSRRRAAARRTQDLCGGAALALNDWSLEGAWHDSKQSARSLAPGAKISFRFHARDLHLVLGPAAGKPVRFRVTLDGQAPGPNAGVDVAANGMGVVKEQRLYQLVRQKGAVARPHLYDRVPRSRRRGLFLHLWIVAEREGFEPSIRFCRILTFQASAFDHSATAPHPQPAAANQKNRLEGRPSRRRRVSGQGCCSKAPPLVPLS